MNKLFLILFFLINWTFADNMVGINSLVLPEDSDYIVNYNSGQNLNEIKKINKEITELTIGKLNKFNTEIIKVKDAESTIVLFNAADSIKDVVKNNSKFVENVRTEDIVPINESMVAVIKKHNNKFYLIGYVNKVSCGELRHKIMTSNNTSWLYNLDIVIKFRLVDAKTLNPIAEFNALGHGGMAKILNSPQQIIEIKPEKIVNETMNALYRNVWHDLLVLNQKVN